MIRVFSVLLLLFSGMSLNAWAQGADGSRYDETYEAEVAQRAKKRLYPGGRDEEDLKVQAQVMTPVRKLAPQADVKEEAVEE